ncbi:tetratricopeptide repeat protein [Saccharibacillus alkalitolerans]|uniref:Tetratricopeptide repeat protein n=1 Tax=Saccharibacillus alkalitolerans TaxID=2705290 RepID=A0ABX0FC62_9BACL|nr:tetratricopeptide repeat protein [Saccharibacillus alkalitolerans]NGZ77544.1 tetratricopeptide repeat protein [Saccharibacillus alkalitolerans]
MPNFHAAPEFDARSETENMMWDHFENALYEAAIVQARQLLSASPDDLHGLYVLAESLRRSGRPDAADEVVRALISQHPERSEGPEVLGNLAEDRGRLSDAIAHYEQALRIEPESALYHYRLSYLLNEQLVRMPRLRQLFRKIEFYPDFLALAERAQQELLTAIRLGGANVVSLTKRAEQLALLFETEAADEHYREAVAADPRFAYTHGSYAAFLLKEGELKKARDHAEQALMLDPYDENALEVKRWIEIGEDQPAKLHAYWFDCLSSRPAEIFDRPEHLKKAILLHARAGKYPLHLYDRYFKRAETDDFEIALLYGQALCGEFEYGRALKHFKKLQSEHPENADVNDWVRKLSAYGAFRLHAGPLLYRTAANALWTAALCCSGLLALPRALSRGAKARRMRREALR